MGVRFPSTPRFPAGHQVSSNICCVTSNTVISVVCGVGKSIYFSVVSFTTWGTRRMKTYTNESSNPIELNLYKINMASRVQLKAFSKRKQACVYVFLSVLAIFLLMFSLVGPLQVIEVITTNRVCCRPLNTNFQLCNFGNIQQQHFKIYFPLI